MPYSVEGKIVIAITSSALFDMTESDRIFREKGLIAYKEHQKKNIDVPLPKGVAFPFVSRLLKINDDFPNSRPVEVFLMSKNSPESGLRAFNSFKHYNLDITRAVLSSGDSNFQYLPAFKADLFLSSNDEDVKEALKRGYPAGKIVHSQIDDDESPELRLAFDFDGVLADDESEKVYKEKGMEEYRAYESKKVSEPLRPGPLEPLLKKLSAFQQMERKYGIEHPEYVPKIKTSIVTARNAPAHERMIRTLNSWGIEVDALFLLGGMNKDSILSILKPHMFFDDQMVHLENIHAPAVHIPFGIANKAIGNLNTNPDKDCKGESVSFCKRIKGALGLK